MISYLIRMHPYRPQVILNKMAKGPTCLLKFFIPKLFIKPPIQIYHPRKPKKFDITNNITEFMA